MILPKECVSQPSLLEFGGDHSDLFAVVVNDVGYRDLAVGVVDVGGQRTGRAGVAWQELHDLVVTVRGDNEAHPCSMPSANDPVRFLTGTRRSTISSMVACRRWGCGEF
jgi:hypothetical protein